MKNKHIQKKLLQRRRPHLRGSSLFIVMIVSISLFSGCAYDGRRESPGFPERYMTSEPDLKVDGMDELTTKLGIEIISLRTTANGRMLDLRYRVHNPDLAREVTKRDSKLDIQIVDTRSGKTLIVPTTHLGMLRTKSFNPKRNRVYYVLFDNAETIVKPGSIVSVWFGGIKADGWIVTGEQEQEIINHRQHHAGTTFGEGQQE